VGAVELSYCIVNTGQRELLLAGLDAVAREREGVPFATEVIVLDNASQDGSAQAAREHPAVDRVIALDRRRGKAENDSTLIAEAAGDLCMLLNEDAILRQGATAALRAALEADPQAAAAGARLLRPDGLEQASAWAFPGWRAAIAGALFLHRRLTVQSGGSQVRRVDWAQSAAMLVRRDRALEVGLLDDGFFVYSDETDLCRRFAERGWSTLHVPGAVAVHHEGLSTGPSARRRIVEFARGRDRFLRKHLGPAQAIALRPLIAFPYLLRSAAAVFLPGHDARRYLWHVEATLAPGRGEGLREAAESFNSRLNGSDRSQPAP